MTNATLMKIESIADRALLVEGIKRTNSVKLLFNLDQWLRSCLLKIFLIWSSGGPFVQWSGTVCAILVEGI